MAAGEFAIGTWKWGPAQGSCVIKYTSSGEVKHTKPAGKNDGRTTFLGRKTGEIDITLMSKDDRDLAGTVDGTTFDGPINNYATAMYADLSPRGPNGGKAWNWSETDQTIHNAYDITVEILTTTRPIGTRSLIATIKLFTWVKDLPAPPATTTAAEPEPWSPGPGGAAPAPPPPAPGFVNTPPSVDP